MAKLKPVSTKSKPLFGAAAAKAIAKPAVKVPVKAAPKSAPRAKYGTGLNVDEQHLKGSVHFQQNPEPPKNPIQRQPAPKKEDPMVQTAAGMSKRFIGGA